MIRLFIVDDSIFLRKILRKIIESTPDIMVVGEADSGREALAAMRTQEVDVVTLDVSLPDMSGIDVLKEIRAHWPNVAVLMLSALTRQGTGTTVEALTLGADDFIDKTRFGSFDVLPLSEQLLEKIRSIGRHRGITEPLRRATWAKSTVDLSAQLSGVDLCVVGASTGGPAAVQRLLESLRAPPAFPIVIAQHMPAGFTREFANRLSSTCACNVHEAVHNERLVSGVAYVAPGGFHLAVNPAWTVQLAKTEEEGSASPSVDVLFLSAAELKVRVCGVLLTGMGTDGARGLAAVKAGGGLTIAQDAASSVVYGMPRAAAELGAVQHQLSLDAIVALFGELATRART